MKRHLFLAIITISALIASGCGTVQKSTNVQKGAAIGGGTMGAIGAYAGYAGTLGGTSGGLIGLAVGSSAGALVADYYYPDDMPDLPSVDRMEQMEEQLGEKEGQVETLRTKLEKEEAQRQALLEATEKSKEELESLRSEINTDDVSITQNKEGHVTMTVLSDLLFDSGEADLTDDGTEVLSDAVETIRDKYPNAKIEVRGHTDNVPIQHSDWNSNWELSAHRALAVVHLLIDNFDIPEDRIRAVGMADTQPVADNDTSDGRKQNRRAEIIVRPESSESE
ncbi:MAG: OmpA family protein [Planctomycetota bacterium]